MRGGVFPVKTVILFHPTVKFRGQSSQILMLLSQVRARRDQGFHGLLDFLNSVKVLSGSEAQRGRESWLFFRVLWNTGLFLLPSSLWLTALFNSQRPFCSQFVWKVSCQKMYFHLRFCVCILIRHLGKEYFSQCEFSSRSASSLAILTRSVSL